MSNRLAMYSAKKLKLGLFGANCSSGRAVTMAEQRWSGSWPDKIDSFELAQACELIRHPGRVLSLMFESVLKPPNEPDPGRFNDLIMLVVAPKGKRANRSAFTYLWREAGFSLMQGIPKAGALPIIGSQPA